MKRREEEIREQEARIQHDGGMNFPLSWKVAENDLAGEDLGICPHGEVIQECSECLEGFSQEYFRKKRI